MTPYLLQAHLGIATAAPGPKASPQAVWQERLGGPGQALIIKAQWGLVYSLVDSHGKALVPAQSLRRRGQNLLVEADGRLVLIIENFFIGAGETGPAAAPGFIVPAAGGEGLISGDARGGSPAPDRLTGFGDTAVWSAQQSQIGYPVQPLPAVPASAAGAATASSPTGLSEPGRSPAAASGESPALSPAPAPAQTKAPEPTGTGAIPGGSVGLLLGGLGLAGGGGGGGGGSSSAAPQNILLAVQVAAGPVIAALPYQVVDAQGQKLAHGQTDASGAARIDLPMAVLQQGLLLIIENPNAAPDYTDETTGTGKDLTAELRAAFVADRLLLSVSVTPLTELAVRLMNLASGPPRAPAVLNITDANEKIGRLFDLESVLTPVLTVLDAGFDGADGLSAEEKYAVALAKLSGLDQDYGGSVDRALAALRQDSLTDDWSGLSAKLDTGARNFSRGPHATRVPLMEVQALGPAQAAILSPLQMQTIGPPQLGQLPQTVISALAPEAVAVWSPAQASFLRTGQANALSGQQLYAIRPESLAAMKPQALGALAPLTLGRLSEAGIGILSQDQAAQLSVAQISAWSPGQLGALSPQALMALSTAVLRNLSGEQLLGLSRTQWAAWQAAQIHNLSLQALVQLDLNTQALIADRISSDQRLALQASQGWLTMDPADIVRLSASDLRGWTAARFAALAPERLAAIEPVALKGLEPLHLQAMSPSQAAMLGAEQLRIFSAGQISQLPALAFSRLAPGSLAALDLDAWAAITAHQAAALRAEQLGGVSAAQLAALNPLSFGQLSDTAWLSLQAGQLRLLGADHGRYLTATHLQKTNADLLAGLPVQTLASLPPEVFSRIPASSFKGLSAKQIQALRPAHLDTLSAEHWGQLQPLVLAALPSLSWASLRGGRLNLLSAEQATALGAQQLAAMAPSVLLTLSDVALSSLSPQAFGQLQPAQLAALTPQQRLLLTSQQWAQLPSATLLALGDAELQILAPRLSQAQQSDLSGARATAGQTAQQVAGWTQAELREKSPAAIAAVAPSSFQQLPPETVRALGQEQLKAITPAQAAALSRDQVTALSPAQFSALSAQTIGHIAISVWTGVLSEQLQTLTALQAAGLNPQQISELSGDKIRQISAAAWKGLSPEVVATLRTEQIAQVGASQSAQLSPQQLQAWSPEQVAALSGPAVASLAPQTFAGLSAEQLQTLRADQSARITARQLACLKDWQLAALAPTALQALPPASLSLLEPLQLASLTPAQLASLSPLQFQALAPRQLTQLAPLALSELSPDVLRLVSGDQLQAFSAVQLQALQPAQVEALAVLALGRLSDAQRAVLALTPAQTQAIAQADQGQNLTAEQAAQLSPQAIATLAPVAIAKLKPQALASLSAAAVGAFSAEQIRALNEAQTEQMDTATAVRFSPQQWAYWSAPALAALPLETLASLSPQALAGWTGPQAAALGRSAVQALTPPQIAALAPAAIAGLQPYALPVMSGQQRQALRAAQAAALEPAQIEEMSAAQLSELSAPAWQALQPQTLAALAARQWADVGADRSAVLRPLQWAALSGEQVAAISPSAIGALDPSVLAALRPDQAAALSAQQVQAITPSQAPALSNPALLAIALPAFEAWSGDALARLLRSQVEALSPAQLAALNDAQRDALAPKPAIGSVFVDGLSQEGSVLQATAQLSDADGLGALSYQWFRGSVPIAGAIASSYTLAQADVGQSVGVRISYTDQRGYAEQMDSALSAPVSPLQIVPVPPSDVSSWYTPSNTNRSLRFEFTASESNQSIGFYVDGAQTPSSFQTLIPGATSADFVLTPQQFGWEGPVAITARIEDQQGRLGPSSAPKLMRIDDGLPSGWISARLEDTDGNDQPSTGDRLYLVFEEPVRLNPAGLPAALGLQPLLSAAEGGSLDRLWSIGLGQQNALGDQTQLTFSGITDAAGNTEGSITGTLLLDDFAAPGITHIGRIGTHNLIDAQNLLGVRQLELELSGARAGQVLQLYLDGVPLGDSKLVSAADEAEQSAFMPLGSANTNIWGADGLRVITASIRWDNSSKSYFSPERHVYVAAQNGHWSQASSGKVLWFDPETAWSQAAIGAGSASEPGEQDLYASAGGSRAWGGPQPELLPRSSTSLTDRQMLRFDGNDGLVMTKPTAFTMPSGSFDFYISTAIRPDANGAGIITAMGQAGEPGGMLVIGRDGNALVASTGEGQDLSAPGLSTGLTQLVSMQGRSVDATRIEAQQFVNGYLAASGTLQARVAGTSSPEWMGLIGGREGDQGYQGLIGDVIYLMDSVGTAWRQEVDSYLAFKYRTLGIDSTPPGLSSYTLAERNTTGLIDDILDLSTTGRVDHTIVTAGSDWVLAGSGQDIIYVRDLSFRAIDGGAGIDSMVLDSAYSGPSTIVLADFSSNARGRSGDAVADARVDAAGYHQLWGIEGLNLALSTAAQTLVATPADVMALTETGRLGVTLGMNDQLIANGFAGAIEHGYAKNEATQAVFHAAYKQVINGKEVGLYVRSPSLPDFPSVPGATAGADTLSGDIGNQLLAGGAGGDFLSGGPGADIFRFGADDTGTDEIADFIKLEGDRIDLVPLLAGVQITAENFGAYLALDQIGSSTTARLRIDREGLGNFSNAEQTVLLAGAWTNDNLAVGLSTLLQDRVIVA